MKLNALDLHKKLENNSGLLLFGILVVSSIGGLVQIIPSLFQESLHTPVADARPYPPLELIGRDIYIRESCGVCHSQKVRPLIAEVERYGPYSRAGEFVYDRPFQWGSRRIGPDLAREGGLRDHLWHYRHFKDPRDVSENSIMPRYPWLLEQTINFEEIQPRVDSMALLGVPYGELLLDNRAVEHARNQALEIAVELEDRGGPSYTETADKKVIALIAYMQRLGTDIKKTEPTAAENGGDQ